MRVKKSANRKTMDLIVSTITVRINVLSINMYTYMKSKIDVMSK